MAERPVSSGSIYDLGYRPYEGVRLGRVYAIASLYVYNLRAVFGLGRSAWSKVLAFGLSALAFVPAAVQLAIAAVSPVDFELVTPEEYFSYVQIIVALFCALSAPELIGRDQRNNTLTLYFSRALSRADYVIAKLAALGSALVAITLLPQILLVLGVAVAAQDLLGYLVDNLGQWPPILASSLLAAVFMASVSLAIASQTTRRAISTGVVFGYFVIATAIGAILVETVTGNAGMYAVLLSPLDVLSGAVAWLFDAEPASDSTVETSDLGGVYLALASIAYSAIATALLLRRFLRMSV